MKYIYTLLFAALTVLTACEENADPFRNQSENVRDAEVKPTAEEPTPGIDEGAMSITLLRDLDSLYFEEGTEYSYEVNVRLYLPDLDFKAELVGAPEGMTLELQSEFNTEVVTAPSSTVDDVATETDEVTPPVAPPASVANQKIYVIKWKPEFTAIPDASIPSITRFVSVRVNIGKKGVDEEKWDKQRTKEFRYTLTQAVEKLRVTSFTVAQDLREGEKRGTAKVYVKYPGLQTNRFPPIYFENTANSTATFAACANLPRAFVDQRAVYITNPNDPNYESIEYSFNMDLTRFDIATNSNSVSCTLNIYVDNLGALSNPYPTTVTVLNTITDPRTTWAENVEVEFGQEVNVQYQFQVFGVQNEGVISLTFAKPCSQVFGSDATGDCKCRTNTTTVNRHIIECMIEANHRKTFSSKTYVIEFDAQVTNGPLSSRKVNFKRRIKFTGGFSLFNADDGSETVDPTAGSVVPPVTVSPISGPQ